MEDIKAIDMMNPLESIQTAGGSILYWRME